MMERWAEVGRKFGLQEQRQLPADFKVEPWMVDFVKGRHLQEEWDAFFVYCEAGPVKRWLIKMGWFFYSVLVGGR